MKVNFVSVCFCPCEIPFSERLYCLGLLFLTSSSNGNRCCQVSALSQTQLPSFCASPDSSGNCFRGDKAQKIHFLIYLFIFFFWIKGEFTSPWDQFTAWVSKKGRTAELSWVLQPSSWGGMASICPWDTPVKKGIVLGVAYITYPRQDIKHWEVREHQRRSGNDAALISVLGGDLNHFTGSVSGWTNKSEACINILPFPHAGKCAFWCLR